MNLKSTLAKKLGLYTAIVVAAVLGFIYKKTDDSAVTFSKVTSSSDNVSDLMLEKVYADTPGCYGCGG
jgi:hypothetical protein